MAFPFSYSNFSFFFTGILWILLLLLMYLIGGAIAIPLAILLILCVLILINEDLQEGMRRAGNQQYIY